MITFLCDIDPGALRSLLRPCPLTFHRLHDCHLLQLFATISTFNVLHHFSRSAYLSSEEVTSLFSANFNGFIKIRFSEEFFLANFFFFTISGLEFRILARSSEKSTFFARLKKFLIFLLIFKLTIRFTEESNLTCHFIDDLS